MDNNTKKKGQQMSRRDFIGVSSLSALGLASLTILPSWKVPQGPLKGKKIAPSDRIVLGFVGLGQQGRSDFRSFSSEGPRRMAGRTQLDEHCSTRPKRLLRQAVRWQCGEDPLCCRIGMRSAIRSKIPTGLL